MLRGAYRKLRTRARPAGPRQTPCSEGACSDAQQAQRPRGLLRPGEFLPVSFPLPMASHTAAASPARRGRGREPSAASTRLRFCRPTEQRVSWAAQAMTSSPGPSPVPGQIMTTLWGPGAGRGGETAEKEASVPGRFLGTQPSRGSKLGFFSSRGCFFLAVLGTLWPSASSFAVV